MEVIYKAIDGDMVKVNDIILAHLKSEEELVGVVGDYLMSASSKRLRPMLTILCSKLFDYQGNAHIDLASAVEFIHTATLLHDDVIDDSVVRRFKPTANTIWGNKTSILVGDFLFSQSFKLMVSAGSMEALRSLANASAIIAEGEVMQLVALNKKRMLTLVEYDQIINAKTAELFGASCEVGGIISGQSKDINMHLKQFGLKLGAVFQVMDDLLDYFGDKTSTGKNTGDDFFEGKVTLPVILACEQSSSEEKKFLEEALFTESVDHSAFKEVVLLMKKYKIQEQIAEYMESLVSDGLSSLAQIQGKDPYKKHLISLMRYAASRNK
ncbi:MAG: polyprenyl synthetase family protein [Pseudomonadota bacterium]